MTTSVLRVLAVLGLVAAAAVADDPPKKPANPTELWIYADVKSEKNVTNATKDDPKGKMFRPFDIMPPARSDDVQMTPQLSASKLDAGAEGTVCHLRFTLGADQWAAVRFTPEGEIAGAAPGLDVKSRLFLGAGIPTWLAFRARTGEGEKAVVGFKIGGVLGDYPDGTKTHPWNRVNAVKPELTERWQTYVIDLKGMHNQLAHVACPLTVTVKAEENPGHTRAERPVDVYLDDLRFTTVNPNPNPK